MSQDQAATANLPNVSAVVLHGVVCAQIPPARPPRAVFAPAPALLLALAGLCMPLAFVAVGYVAYLLRFKEDAAWRGYTLGALAAAPVASFSYR